MPVDIYLAGESQQVLDSLDSMSKGMKENLAKAINKVAAKYRKETSRRIQQQVNIPAGQLEPSAGILTISKKASPSNLDGRIRADGRKRGLAEFSHGGTINKKGVAVSVKRTNTIFLKESFYVNFAGKKGRASPKDRTSHLAIYLKKGEKIQNRMNVEPAGGGLFVMDAPSAQQLVKDNKGDGVWRDIEPLVVAEVQEEVIRLAEVFGN